MKRVAFYTLGCKVNQYETQAMAEMFSKAGYEVVDPSEPADVVVINTCTVTNISDRKSRQMLRRAKRKNPNAVAVVTGCYAQTAPGEVSKIEGVNLVVGTKDRADIVSLVEKLTPKDQLCRVGDIMHTHSFEPLSVSGCYERTRAYIKVQEGCSQYCSYCIIPYARGPVRSRAIDEVVAEAKRLAQAGYLEIVLVGIHIASYGKDIGGTCLADMIRRIDRIDGIKRIRLSSIEPMTLDDTFIDAVRGCGKLCPHFHISLQSGCDDTLLRMNRKYSTGDYKRIVEGLRAAFPDVAVTTDVMVGFPGEDALEFEKSLEFVRSIGFANIHIFEYSPRRGTPASKMGGQVDPKEKHRRSEMMFAVARESRIAFLNLFVGRHAEVLFEQELTQKKGYYEGKTKNYITVVCRADDDVSGQIHKVKLLRAKDEYMEGEILF